MPRIVLMLLLLAAPLAGAAAGSAERHSAVVLMYHHVGDSRYPSTNVTLEQFESHLDFFEREGFSVWPLARVVEHLRQRRPLPDKTVAITFDDAYRSVYREAFPRLRARGLPFTVFVSTGYTDRGYSNYMSWSQMQEMAAAGATFGNHSTSHDHLVVRREGESEAQWRQRVREDLEHAQRRLEEELGQEAVVPIVAYPYGEYDLALAELVAELGWSAFGQQSGAAGFTSDPRFLPRFPVNEAYGDLEKGLKIKLLSLALPLRSVEPLEPVTSDERPELRLELAVDIDHLNCFATGQGAIEVRWIDRQRRLLATRAHAPLPRGRSRYNCTALSGEPGRYYWFSHPWLRF